MHAQTKPRYILSSRRVVGRGVRACQPLGTNSLSLTALRVLFVGCLTSQQHASVSHGWICSDKFTCCHTEIEAAGQTFYLTQSQYTDTRPISPSADPVTPGTWQGSHWSAIFKSLEWLDPGTCTWDLLLSRQTHNH